MSAPARDTPAVETHFHIMPFKIVEPPYGCLMREFSPEVPQHVRDTLELGEPPYELTGACHPVVVLLRERWKSRGMDRKEFARRDGGEAGYAKTIRRVDELRAGKRLLPVWIERVATGMDVSPADLQAAWRAESGWRNARKAFQIRRNRHRIYDRYSSYLLAFAAEDWNPVSRPTPDLKSMNDLHEVHGYAELHELIPWIHERREHRICGGAPIHGFLYVRAPEDLHFLTADGTLLASGDSRMPTPPGFREYFGEELPL
jgi:hypothetical protein